MTHKLKQQLDRSRRTQSIRLPSKRASIYLINIFRTVRRQRPVPALRASLGLVKSKLATITEHAVSTYRASCFLTGRSRGTSRRFVVARTRLKELASTNLLFGLRKSSF